MYIFLQTKSHLNIDIFLQATPYLSIPILFKTKENYITCMKYNSLLKY